MALGTSWTQIASKDFTYLGYDGTAYVYAKLQNNGQSVANNTSKVDLELRVWHSVWVQSYDTDFYLSGYGWLGYAYRSFDSGTTTIMSSTVTVNHNADGTGTLSATGGYEYKGIGVDATQFSGSIALPTIPRASAPTATPNPLTIGSSGATLTVNTNRKSSSFTHTIKVQCGSWSWTSSARAVGASVNVTVPYSVIAQFSATSKTATATVTCTTFNGTTQIASAKTCSVTFQVSSSVDHANVGTITVEDTNSRTSAITQDDSIYIANISTLEATIPLTVSGSYTELASATVTCGNKSQSYTLSGTSQTITFTFDKVTASSLSVTVKDKRGNSVTSTKTWTLIAYQPVTAVATVGRPSATGSVGVGQLTGMAYGGNFGATQNSLSITIDFKKHDDPDYDPQGTETATLALSQSGYNSYTDAFTFVYTLDYQYQYDIKFTVSDLFSTATYVAQLMQGLPIISWDETEVDVFGDLHIHDRDNPTQWQDVMEGFDAVFENHGEKNLCQLTNPSLTQNGVTFTRYADYVNVNGTATANAFFRANEHSTELVQGHRYILSGLHDEWQEGMEVVVRYLNSTDIIAQTGKDDVEFTCPGDCFPYLLVRSGTTVNNKKWYPMIRDARVASPTFVPNWGINNWNYSGQWTGNSNVTRTYKITGKGLVFAMATVLSDTTNDTGTAGAYVDLRTSSAFVRTLGANRNRLTTANTNAIQASATGVYFYDGTSSNNHLRLYAGCSKGGTNSWYFELVTIGCSVNQV